MRNALIQGCYEQGTLGAVVTVAVKVDNIHRNQQPLQDQPNKTVAPSLQIKVREQISFPLT